MSKRVQVKVIAEFDTIGKTTPIKLTWPDGREFAIDQVLDVRPAPAKSGGSGIRYTCRILGQEVPIYFDTRLGIWWCDGKDEVS